MKLNQIAAQLYTVREHLQTPTAIAASLKKVRAIGYEAVQASALGPIAEDDLRRLLRNEGLTLCATHEPGDRILREPEAVAARLKKLECRHTAYPHPGGIPLDTVADVTSFAARLNAAGRVLHEAGLTLSYHNHHMEFRRVGGRPILDIIYAETDPRYLKAELDTYWIQHGGGDPVDWCRRMTGRMPLVHLKDFAINSQNQIVFAELGNGNLHWNAIIAAAETSGCEWFIVEQDTCPGDPFDSLRQSFEFLKTRFVPA